MHFRNNTKRNLNFKITKTDRSTFSYLKKHDVIFKIVAVVVLVRKRLLHRDGLYAVTAGVAVNPQEDRVRPERTQLNA